MPFGFLEIAIVLVIAFIFFGYKYLPSIGRSAGTGARELKESVGEMVGDKVNPETIGRSAGKGMREAREFRDAVTGKGDTSAATRPKPAPAPAAQSAPPPSTKDEGADGETSSPTAGS